MDSRLYVIYDKVAEESGPIFEAKNENVAIRHFQQLIQKAPVHQDYKMLYLGIIDHDTSEIQVNQVPIEVNTSKVVDDE